jgi:hypothetical protein
MPAVVLVVRVVVLVQLLELEHLPVELKQPIREAMVEMELIFQTKLVVAVVEVLLPMVVLMLRVEMVEMVLLPQLQALR